MMPHAQRQIDLAHVTGLDANGAIATSHDSMIGRSQVRETESAQQLYELLEHLGVSADTAATRCFWHVHGTTARAVANIKDWMTYLPKSCVRAMVNDGWHWTS
jgi:hypothetical protein